MNWYNKALDDIKIKVDKTSVRIKDSLPHVTIDGIYSDESFKPRWWTNGFWPGILWMMYKETNEEKYKEYAELCEVKLDAALHDYYAIDHDAGFLWHLSAVANYKQTGNEEAKRRGMIAASHLASRFNVNGNFIRAWDWIEPDTGEAHTGWAIIDCMMNLPLLFWASLQVNDPRFRSLAMKHADTVLREFIREDGSVNHVVSFDPYTGERIESIAGMADAPDSAWARGTAWAIYGMTLAYKYTDEKKYLDAAKKVAKFFISNLPEDYLPVWDFRATKETRHVKDSSAAACTACGLLEMSYLCEGDESKYYYNKAESILKSLYENYSSFSDNSEGLIKMGTVNVPRNKFLNTSIIYGDFFFIEGILKLNNKKDILW